jgi:DNA-binding response OmpR family regulator
MVANFSDDNGGISMTRQIDATDVLERLRRATVDIARGQCVIDIATLTDVIMLLQTRTAAAGEEPPLLTGKEYRLYRRLCANRGTVVDADELSAAAGIRSKNQMVALAAHITRLKPKLIGERIGSVRGRGYMLVSVGDVVEEEGDAECFTLPFKKF